MKVYHYLFAAALCAALAMSCKKDGPAEDPGNDDNNPPVTGTPEAMTFTVTPEDVSIDGYDNTWAAGDCISIFEGAANNKFEFTADNKFDGSAIASGSYYALYPYSESAELAGDAITVEIPSGQTGEITDLIAIGYSASGDMSMKNATGLLKFTLEEDNVTKVTISGNDGQVLAGKVSIAWNNGEPTISEVEGGSTTVSVGDGETVLEKGDYYVNIVPVKLVGYTVTLTYKYDDSSYTGYFDTWEPGMTKESGVKMEYVRGNDELPVEYPEGLVNMTRGKMFELQDKISSTTLVFYDDELKTTVNGVTAGSGSWDSYDDKTNSFSLSCTTDPYEGSNCIEWTCAQTWGQVGSRFFGDDEYARGILDLTAYRNAHFSLQFAYKADPGTLFYVMFLQHFANEGAPCLRIFSDLSEYATGQWQLVTIPLDEMKVSEYAAMTTVLDAFEHITVDDGTFDTDGNPFRWDKVMDLVFKFNIDGKDMSQKGKTVYIDDIKITKVIISDQTAE